MRMLILTACLWFITPPVWSKIVFCSSRDGNDEIYTMNADGSNQTRLTFHEADDWQPTWSPSGRQIAFVSVRSGDWNSEIYIMNADGTNLRQLTHYWGEDAEPDWSPDGSQIAFVSERNSPEDSHDVYIFVMDIDGNNIR